MPNSLLITIFIISILGSAFAFAFMISRFNQDISVIKAGIFGVTGYFFLYVFVSSILLFFDVFTISKTVIICASVIFCFFVFSLVNIKKFKRIKFCKKELIVFIAVLLAAAVLSGGKFGFYGMGQDQGVYQTKAIEFMYGNNSNELNFDYALKTLSDPADYIYFRDKVRELQGYYLVGQTEPFYADENAGGKSGLEGVYHGLPTWPAILALFGKMFGMSHMQECQTIFFVCYLMITFYILENFKIKTLYEALGVAVLGSTPLVVWVSKSALTEMFLTVIMAFFVYLSCHKNRDVRLFMWIPVAVFSVYHVSVYTLMPLFVICGWLLLVTDKRKRAVIPTLLMLAVYFWGFNFSVKLETLYTSFNYLRPINKLGNVIPGFNVDNNELLLILAVILLICAGITLLIPFIVENSKTVKLLEKVKANAGIIIKASVLVMTVFVMIAYAANNRGFLLNPNYNPVALSFAAGIFGTPLIFAGTLFIKKDTIKDTQTVLLYWMFIYILFWSVTLRSDIPYFYYSGRYDAPFVIIPVLLLLAMYRDFGKKEWIPLICLSSVLLYLSYDTVMIKTSDDTKVAWDTVEGELNKEVKPGSAVIIDSNTNTLLEWMLILKASGKEVYPAAEDLNIQTDKLSEFYDNIYYLYESPEDFNIEDITDKEYRPLYINTFVHSEDLVNGTESWIGYPEYFDSEENHTYMYMYSKN
ncbi:MAG: hypothetical protein IKS56_08965 [Lachnospiraceae bacterium]|nr:hypothetical protein [Lachnospiraceae bacterium]